MGGEEYLAKSLEPAALAIIAAALLSQGCSLAAVVMGATPTGLSLLRRRRVRRRQLRPYLNGHRRHQPTSLKALGWLQAVMGPSGYNRLAAKPAPAGVVRRRSAMRMA